MEENEQKSSADRTKARHCAKGLLQSAKNKNVPIKINDVVIAAKNDFDVIVVAAPKGAFKGKGDALTQRRGNSIYIVYDQEKSVVRKRFSVAHELGHIYLGHLHGNSSVDINSTNFDEIEANIFAANILMPKKLLSDDIKSGMRPEELAKKYEVSLESLWYQLTSEGLINLLHKS